MKKKGVASEFWERNKLTIERISLLLLLLAMAVLLPRLFKDPDIEEKMVVCFACRNTDLMRINARKIEEFKCSVCGGRIGIGWKCRDCHYEFPIIIKPPPPEIKKDEYPGYYLNFCKCPNCGSVNTDPMLMKGRKK